jgi:LacI family transcriptional regulator
MATLADVAALARVSKATASRALSRPEMVSGATVTRVLDAAAALGFIPNSAARHLARGRSGIVALVVPTLDNSFFTPIIGGAQRRADEEGLQLTVAVHPLEAVRELVALERLARQVDGFIVAAPRGSDDLVLAAGSHVPTALVDRFVAEGHRRIVYVGGPGGSWQDRQRTAAVTAAAADRAELTVLGPCPSTFAAGVGVAEAVRGSGATAVVPYATAIGLGIQYALLASGGAGREVVVSSERSVVDALGLTGVPAVDVDGDELGRAAAELLLERIRIPDAEPTRTRLPVPIR